MNTSTPIPTILIGLGGSGAWTLVHVKKQLLDTYDNDIPSNINLTVMDTAQRWLATLGTESVERMPGMGVGSVSLVNQEYAHIGGDTYSMVKRIDADKSVNWHIASWFDSSWYLENMPRNLFLLEEGAGRFRQFGRLAIFRDVMTEANSTLDNVLRKKLVEISNQSRDGRAMTVMIVGSLVGGTGAGLFLDVPHLVRRIADTNGISDITIQGFFYLPQAFRGTLLGVRLNEAMTRSAAALREMDRFLLNEDYKLGYPMHYHSPRQGQQQNIYRARQTDKLYDYVYLVDGEMNNLNQREIENGVAPVLADAIVNFMDQDYGPEHNQYALNLRADMTNAYSSVGKRSFVSSIGAYSIILPIQQIIESWAYDLSLEFLQRLVPPSQIDDSGHVLSIASNKNPAHNDGDVDKELDRLLANQTPITDEEGNQILPMGLWGSVWGYFRTNQSNENMLKQELEAYRLGDWLDLLAPSSTTSQDPQLLAIVRETESILGESLNQTAKNSNDRKPRGEPADDYAGINKAAESYITRQLGATVTGGGRGGGRYGEALKKFQNAQINRFNTYLSAYITETLNGGAGADPINRLTGKLGWVLAVIKRKYDVFANVYQIFEGIQAGRGEFERDERVRIQQRVDTTYREMVESANASGLGSRRQAVNKQDAYIQAVQQYVNYFRAEFARNMVMDVIRSVRDSLRQARRDLENWSRVLATDTESLYNQLIDGKGRVKTEGERASNIENHRVIGSTPEKIDNTRANDPGIKRDTEWINRRYQELLSRDEGAAQQAFFEAWHWRTAFVDGRLNVQAALTVNEDRNAYIQLEGNMERHAWHLSNIQGVLDFARRYFQAAVSQLSVLEYLMEMYPGPRANELGQELKVRSGSLLSVESNPLTGVRTTNDHLLVNSVDNLPGAQEWLRTVLGGLESAPNQTTGSVKADIRRINDRFRLTILSLTDLIPLEGVRAYEQCLAQYNREPKDVRQRAHVFPAEIHAAQYETSITDVFNVPPRALEKRVTLLLENENRFNEFLELLVFGMIYVAPLSDTTSVQTQNVWMLRAPTRTTGRGRGRDELEYWWLSAPSSDSPSLLQALTTYCVVGKDYRISPGVGGRVVDNVIPSDYVLRMLDNARKQETLVRISHDELAVRPRLDEYGEPMQDADGYYVADFDEELREWLTYYMIKGDFDNNDHMLEEMTLEERRTFLDVAHNVVRHDKLDDMADWMQETQLPDLDRKVNELERETDSSQNQNALRDAKEERDIYAISVIAMREECNRLRDLISTRYAKDRGQKRGF